MRKDSTANVLWFVAGISIGAAIGVVMAPQSGADTRRKIGEKAGEAGHFLANSGKEYLDRGRELYDRGKQLADEAAEMFDEGRRLVEEAEAEA